MAQVTSTKVAAISHNLAAKFISIKLNFLLQGNSSNDGTSLKFIIPC